MYTAKCHAHINHICKDLVIVTHSLITIHLDQDCLLGAAFEVYLETPTDLECDSSLIDRCYTIKCYLLRSTGCNSGYRISFIKSFMTWHLLVGTQKIFFFNQLTCLVCSTWKKLLVVLFLFP